MLRKYRVFFLIPHVIIFAARRCNALYPFFMVPEIGASRLNQTLKKDAQTMPFYVVFDNRENRQHYGYISCQQAKVRGIFSQ